RRRAAPGGVRARRADPRLRAKPALVYCGTVSSDHRPRPTLPVPGMLSAAMGGRDPPQHLVVPPRAHQHGQRRLALLASSHLRAPAAPDDLAEGYESWAAGAAALGLHPSRR